MGTMMWGLNHPARVLGRTRAMGRRSTSSSIERLLLDGGGGGGGSLWLRLDPQRHPADVVQHDVDHPLRRIRERSPVGSIQGCLTKRADEAGMHLQSCLVLFERDLNHHVGAGLYLPSERDLTQVSIAGKDHSTSKGAAGRGQG